MQHVCAATAEVPESRQSWFIIMLLVLLASMRGSVGV